MKILNFGSLNIDNVYSVDHFVRPGETLSSDGMSVFCGGKGLNQSLALARAGAEVYHAGMAGQDGGMLLDVMEKSGVRTQYVKKTDGVTGHAIIQVNRSGQNCILLFGGANQQVTGEFAEEVLSHFDKGDWLLLQNEISSGGSIMETASKKGMIIVLNPSPMDAKILKLPLELVDYFILNEVEAAELCGCDQTEKMADELQKKFPRAKIVLTLGSKGAVYQDAAVRAAHGIYNVPVVDTTAAGDTFTGFFIEEISNHSTPEKALELASKASSLAVSKKGAEPSIPTMEEVKNSKLKLQ
nr:ribokinase [uncultured Caproiciproducens sp.]